ncbi:MAG: deoxyuridine 5'-triphosphate nucleotidohydrolase [Halalkalicoccus sp.]|nr:deoxyuridine 5'-triphosphate nucleotidohydrolase [Halalkalicoccus sp.]
MYRDGAYVSEHVTPTTGAQIQPNGVDLTLDAIFEPLEPGRITRNDKEIGERQRVASEEFDRKVPETYYLEPGGYVVRYDEVVEIPEGHVGFVYPRSSLMRNGCMLDTAVWDAGYQGRGEGLLEVHHDIELERGARIAQLVFAEADHEGTYEGAYQGENYETPRD